MIQVKELFKRNKIKEYFSLSRQTTEQLCSPLSAEDQNVQSMEDASPTKWHKAHTTWFFETFILKNFLKDYKIFNEKFAFLFNSYYQTFGERQPRSKRGLLSKPSLEEIDKYRKYVNENIDHLVDVASDDNIEEVCNLITLGINHEQQHQELILMDILHAFFLNPLKPSYKKLNKQIEHKSNKLSWKDIEGGIVEIGQDFERSNKFFYDNEGPKHEVLLKPFQISNRPITNREWLEFMDDGGYQKPELWLSDGWEKVNANNWQSPLYWLHDKDLSWYSFSLYGLHPLSLDAPVSHVSFYEANAYATWRSKRLPTEFEWEIASSYSNHDGNLLDENILIPKINLEKFKLSNMIGGVWEYTSSNDSPYPNYSPSKGAIGEYNGKFMINQFVLRGGCCLTSQNHIRNTYRNFFYPSQRWMFSGVRLAN